VGHAQPGLASPTRSSICHLLGTTAAILASAEEGSGFGTYVLSASVVLDIPPAAAGGPYGGSLTITAVEAGP